MMKRSTSALIGGLMFTVMSYFYFMNADLYTICAVICYTGGLVCKTIEELK